MIATHIVHFICCEDALFYADALRFTLFLDRCFLLVFGSRACTIC
jgi:hypothetical protein